MRDYVRSRGSERWGWVFIVILLSATISNGQAPSTNSPKEEKQESSIQASAATPPQTDTVVPAQPAPPPPQPVKAPAAATPPPPTERVAASGVKNAKTGKKPSQAGGKATADPIDTKPYLIGAEDILYLNVLHQPDVSQQLTVRPDGFVSVRFANEIMAAGLTTQQLADAITEKLNTYFMHPEVNIQVVAIRSKKYYVNGQVRRPGSYNLSTPKTVLEALIEAGGPAEFAKTKAIFILRGADRIPFNYNDVSKGRRLEQNILLQNGDVVNVP
jgi:polysaccharide export outer membrane protein